MTEAACRQRQTGELDTEVQGGGRQRPADPREVLFIRLTLVLLKPAVLGVAERIEDAAAQAPDAGEGAEHGPQPGTEAPLERMPGERIAAADPGRRHVVGHPVARRESFIEGAVKGAVGVEPRHLVFVLGGQDLEIALGDGALKGVSADRRPGLRDAPHLVDHGAVMIGQPRAAVTRQQLGPRRNDVVQGGVPRCPGCLQPRRRPHGIGVESGAPAPQEGRAVGLGGDAVQLDGAFQCRPSDRNHPLLPGQAEQEDIGRDRVAGELRRQRRGVDHRQGAAAELAFQRRHQRRLGEGAVGIA